MGMFSILDVSAAGMDVQQAKLSAARPGDAVYTPMTVVVHSTTANGLPRPVVTGTAPLDVQPHLVYDPGHPDADERGFVSRPGTDPIASMLDLISISRNYEANLRAFDVTRTLLQRTLDMGSRR
jgi:flagellar basal-body rod protein FlgC